MDEMRLLQRLGDETELPADERLGAARTRLVGALTATEAAPVRRARRPAWRLVLTGVATASVAASLAAVLVLAPDRIGGSAPAARADARQVLRDAAVTALRLPDVEPRPDQFVYTRSQNGRELRESWASVDGTRDGLVVEYPAGGRQEFVLPGCRDGRAKGYKGGQLMGTEPCVPEPAYDPAVPTDATAMRAYLDKHRSGEPGDVNAAAKDVLFLLDSYLRPRSRAALFEAAAATPGLKVVEKATDGAGRSGVGVSWPSPGSPALMVLVFDPRTYAFLGVGGEAGTSAVLSVAIVDQVGQKG
ncbi:CU044_5270 family protein [Micromonospora tulbaghiae]|uniref:CU044_5270 family protein n=1 Tax=Micromonospora tulbaghiae TaxID=479978 RepID=UPI0029C58DC6|nr:CU044_5270 family protein [Micromonospora tulbaghiae]MDX5459674.1 CU044_5270 family protein [Micromonospora tulbaghiae]